VRVAISLRYAIFQVAPGGIELLPVEP